MVYMFKIEDLLGLFPDENIKKMLVYSYFLSQESDKDLSDGVFEQLLLLKKQDPNINIILDPSKEKSYFSPDENTIYINNLSIETFFHELTHLLSYNYLSFQVPNEYDSFKRSFMTNKDNTSLIVQFLDLCERKKVELVQSFSDEDVNVYDNNLNEMNDAQQEPQSRQLDLIHMMEDIVDSIYDGQSFTYGLVSIKDNNSNAFKTKKTFGHGCEYFSSSDYQFEEILANYQAIKLIDPNNELFALLKNIIGNDFVSFLDERCCEMCGTSLKTKIDINNIAKR